MMKRTRPVRTGATSRRTKVTAPKLDTSRTRARERSVKGVLSARPGRKRTHKEKGLILVEETKAAPTESVEIEAPIKVSAPEKSRSRAPHKPARPRVRALAPGEKLGPRGFRSMRELQQDAPAVEQAPSENQAHAGGSSTLSLYMREMGQVPLLTPEEEIELAARIKKGDEEARQHMIKANLRLVVKIAREYEGLGLPLLDLINEGNIGLMKAVDRFDPAKGGKLSTYSSWWIKQSIRRAIANQSKTIRLPVHVIDQISHMRRAEMQLQELLGREPSDSELAEELGVKTHRVRRLREAAIRPASLDAPLGDDETNRLGDVIADDRAETPYQDLERRTSVDLLQELLTKLSPREATILRFRFGLDGAAETTLEEIGKKFGVTRERIRQLQNAALNKLRRMMEEEHEPETAKEEAA